MTNITIAEFIQLLWENFYSINLSSQELLHYAHVKGWIEDQDEVNRNDNLDRRTTARIIHKFIKIELHILDSPNITRAEILKDLYTCRVCANHIAQVFVKGIMDCEEIVDSTNGEILKIFNMNKLVSSNDAEEIIKRISL